ncbi:MAG: hypothetical protein SPK18_08990 [Treponema sp.]|nr:hypothetical protein [Spirochaetia bacterium]MDD7533819.1 hypothetical protein [Treponema sp.]MDY3722678.1 hypothetical protein [Treponema sp.]MDY5758700.1 hypothetical protein [Treponema sp.]MDY5819515.1 hypothetical protein [Treponema sp.]
MGLWWGTAKNGCIGDFSRKLVVKGNGRSGDLIGITAKSSEDEGLSRNKAGINT